MVLPGSFVEDASLLGAWDENELDIGHKTIVDSETFMNRIAAVVMLAVFSCQNHHVLNLMSTRIKDQHVCMLLLLGSRGCP